MFLYVKQEKNVPDRDIFVKHCDPIWANATRETLSGDNADSLRIVEQAIAAYLRKHGGELLVRGAEIGQAFIRDSRANKDCAWKEANGKLNQLRHEHLSSRCDPND